MSGRSHHCEEEEKILAIRENTEASKSLLAWLQQQVDSESLNKKLEELKASIESAILRTETKIMSALTDFADRVETVFGSIGTSVDGIVESIAGINTDVQQLKQQITDLQNSGGAITPEDQARLDTIETGVNALATKTAAAATVASELDAQTENAPTP